MFKSMYHKIFNEEKHYIGKIDETMSKISKNAKIFLHNDSMAYYIYTAQHYGFWTKKNRPDL